MPADPTLPIRRQASNYPGSVEGTSCTQSAFKNGKTAFLYIGTQGGRYKAMFKLQASLPEAVALAKKHPDLFQAGSTAWVTARFTEAEPLPPKIWKKWLDESYALSGGGAKGSSAKKATKKKTSKKAASKKKTTKKKTATKKTAKKKATRKKAAKKKATKKKSAKKKV